MLASTIIIGQNVAVQNAAALENVIASKTVTQGSSGTTTIDAVNITAEKSTTRSSGTVTVAIVQGDTILATSEFSTSALSTFYKTVQVTFNAVKVTGDFLVAVMYVGSGYVSVSSITVVGTTTVPTDSTAPSAAITSPAGGATVSTGTRTVQGTASDSGSGVNTVQVRLDGGSYVAATPKAAGDWSTWSASVNISTAGSHTIYARATDKAGNYKEVSVTVTASAPAPTTDTVAPSVAITQPAANSVVILAGGSIVVTGTASDGGSGVRSVDVRADSGSYVAATPKAAGDWSTWSVTLPVTSGERRLVPRATDNAGNQAWNSIYVTAVIDGTAPAVAITSPSDSSTVPAGTLAVQGTSSDNAGGSGVSTVEVRLDGGSYVAATPKAAGDWSTWSASFGTLTAGSHTISARATDKAGNQRVISASITAAPASDTTAPSIAITDPAANSIVTVLDGNILVTGTASDGGSGIRSVDVRVDSGSYVAATPKAAGDWSTWSVTLPITVGERRLVPRATDNAGNNAWNSIYVTITDTPSGDGGTIDKFGVEKLYPTVAGGNEWYVNMDDPTSDPNFRNLGNIQFSENSDGSWRVSASQIRMEAWSPANEKWLNVEITGYARMVSGSNELIQWYSRGGHHTSSNECLGSAYKARLYGDGEARWVKEVTHPSYTSNRGSVQATNTPLEDRWIGLKAVIYNFVENGKTYVRMESYIDDDVTDSNGNLVVANDWELASVVEDRGGWSTTNSDFDASCAPANKDSTQQYRQRDEILNLPGGTSTQNIAAWRSDGLTWDFKYLSVREIVPT